jgi:hypothetical protein
MIVIQNRKGSQNQTIIYISMYYHKINAPNSTCTFKLKKKEIKEKHTTKITDFK